MTSTKVIRLFSLFCLLTLWGSTSACMKPEVPIYHYTLASTAQPGLPRTGLLAPLLLGPIDLASFLDQGPIITQNSPYSITIEEQHRWAGDLSGMLMNVILRNLSLALGTNIIYNFTRYQQTDALQIMINFLHFERDSKGDGLLMARWQILATDTGIILHSATSTIRNTPAQNNFASLSQALSHGLGQLSTEIAVAVTQLPSPARKVK